VGSVGWLGPLATRNKHPPAMRLLVKMSEDQLTPIRDPKTGLCIPCGANEPGEFLAMMMPGQAYVGYTDAKANDSKVIADVAVKGDRWLRQGDLLRFHPNSLFLPLPSLPPPLKTPPIRHLPLFPPPNLALSKISIPSDESPTSDVWV